MERTTRIVIAEDHVLVRDGLRLLLSIEPGLEVVAETGDGAGVLPMVQRCEPDLLLLDLGLPGRWGVDIVSEVKAACGQRVKVVVLTGDATLGTARQALAAGADGYALKSDDTGELLHAVRAVIGGEQFVSRCVAELFRAGAGSAGTPLPTPREQEIMSLVARGLSNKEIAEVLAIGLSTVRTHRQNFMEKFALRNAAEITAYAVQQGYYKPA